MNERYVVVKSQSTTSYFIVPSHMNSGSHLITFTTSPSHNQEEYTINASEETKEIVKHYLYSLNLNYYICIMSGIVWWSLQKAPNSHNIIHTHSWIRRVLTCYFCMYDPTPWALVTTHNSISGRMEEVTSCRQVINNSTQ